MSFFRRFISSSWFSSGSDCDGPEPEPYTKIIDRCKILFCRDDVYSRFAKPRFSFECDKGWFEPLELMCYKLEQLNWKYYPECNMRIHMSQIKEKFGVLRVYFDVVADPKFKAKYFLRKELHSFANFLCRKVDFKMTSVVDKPRFCNVHITQLKKPEFIKEKHSCKHISNAEAFETDGKFFKICEYDSYEIAHREPTRCVMIYKLCEHIESWCRCNSRIYSRSPHQEMIERIITDEANAIIREAENACHNVCMHCGSPFSTIEDSAFARCETLGYVRYLCRECAIEFGGHYLQNGAEYLGDTMVKTKEEVIKENKMRDQLLARSNEKYIEEEKQLEQEIAAAEQEENAQGSNQI